jgi:glycosyltransferase involved in cell wall biosynthesis
MPASPAQNVATAATPRVLVVTNVPFTRAFSNGKTMSSLFEGWPKDALAQVYIPFATHIAPMFDVCERYWALGPTRLRRVSRLSVDARPERSGEPTPWRSGLGAIAAALNFSSVARIGYPLREIVYSNPLIWRGREMEEVLAFQPDVIFTMVGSLSGLSMVNRLSSRLGIPIVPLITDDWIATEYTAAYGSRILRALLQGAFDEYLSRSPVCLVISRAMAAAYAVRYGRAFRPFTQGVDAALYDPVPHVDDGRARLRLVYAGNIGLGRAKALEAVGTALRGLEQRGILGELVVYASLEQTRAFGDRLAKTPCVQVAGHATHAELPAIYRDADVLIHCESFDEEVTRYTALSLSTKLSEYLMAGRPILAFGPAHLSAMQHVSSSHGGVVVGTEDPAHLSVALERLLVDSEARRRLGRAGREFALEEHEISAQTHRFRQALVDARELHRRGLVDREAGRPAPAGSDAEGRSPWPLVD